MTARSRREVSGAYATGSVDGFLFSVAGQVAGDGSNIGNKRRYDTVYVNAYLGRGRLATVAVDPGNGNLAGVRGLLSRTTFTVIADPSTGPARACQVSGNQENAGPFSCFSAGPLMVGEQTPGSLSGFLVWVAAQLEGGG